MPKTRQSKFELLRIVSMLMIVAHHFALHSGFVFSGDSPLWNVLWQNALLPLGKVGVDAFVLISGYFLVQSEKLKITKILRLWGQLAFYSMACYVIFLAAGKATFSFTNLVQACLPVLSGEWWFASTYFVLFLFSPFINQLLHTLTQKQYKTMLGIMFALWSVAMPVQFKGVNFSSLGWFVFLYALAGYIRLHGDNLHVKPVLSFAVAFISVIVTIPGCIVTGRLTAYAPIFGNISGSFYEMHSPFVLLAAMALFLGFRDLKIPICRPVNLIASATFGVYLIHDSSYVRPFLWKDFLHCADHGNGNLLIPYSIVVILGVFVACVLMDLLRQYTVEKLYLKLIEKCSLFKKKG